MDLGKCPKCGRAWTKGMERCLDRECGYVPVGAGIRPRPPKEKKDYGPYREGASWQSTLLGLTAVGVVVYAVMYRPWENGFAKLRTMLGQPVSPRVDGDWVVTRVFAGGNSEMAQPCDGVIFGFGGGNAKLKGSIGGQPYDAAGSYVLAVDRLSVDGWKGEGADRIPAPFRAGFSSIGTGEAVLTLQDKTTMFLARAGATAGDVTASAYRSGSGGSMMRVGD